MKLFHKFRDLTTLRIISGQKTNVENSVFKNVTSAYYNGTSNNVTNEKIIGGSITHVQKKSNSNYSGHNQIINDSHSTINITSQPQETSTSFRNLSKISTCLAKNSVRESYHLLWMLSDWNERGWHGTDVLIAESRDTVAIIFRGSENSKDAITNIQTMEPVYHSRYFKGILNGSIHRGILNAYSRVDSGQMTILNVPTKSTDYSPFSSTYKKAFDNCLPQPTKPYRTGDKCWLKNTSLAQLLIQSVLVVLKSSHKKILITGHSLGGSLAFLLVMDLFVNYAHKYLPSSTSIISQNHWPWPWKKSKIQWIKTALMNQVRIYTFGEPEILDELFVNDLRNNFPDFMYFMKIRYKRFISLTKYPSCQSDIVTRLTSQVASMIGERLSGVGGGHVGRKKRRRNRYKNRSSKKKKKLKTSHNHINNETMNDTTKSVDNSTMATSTGTILNNSREILLFKSSDQQIKDRIFTDETDIDSSLITTFRNISDIYLSSDAASNPIEAHSMLHYLRGMAQYHRYISYEKSHRKSVLEWLLFYRNNTTKERFRIAVDIDLDTARTYGFLVGDCYRMSNRTIDFFEFVC